MQFGNDAPTPTGSDKSAVYMETITQALNTCASRYVYEMMAHCCILPSRWRRNVPRCAPCQQNWLPAETAYILSQIPRFAPGYGQVRETHKFSSARLLPYVQYKDMAKRSRVQTNQLLKGILFGFYHFVGMRRSTTFWCIYPEYSGFVYQRGGLDARKIRGYWAWSHPMHIEKCWSGSGKREKRIR